MRSADERMKLLKARSCELKEKRRTTILTVLSYAACFCITAAMSAFAAFNMRSVGFGKPAAENTASIFADTDFFGYVSVGILAFLLGVSVTLLCSMLHRRSKEEHRK